MVTNTTSGNSAERDALEKAIELKDSTDYKDRLLAITAFAFHFDDYISKTAEKHLNDLKSDPVPAVAELAAEALNRSRLMP